MSGLTRTDLTTCNKVDLAAASVARQGMYGVVTELAKHFGVSRPTVYSPGKATAFGGGPEQALPSRSAR